MSDIAFNDFVMKYDNFYSKEECEFIMRYFDVCEAEGHTLTRRQTGDAPAHFKNDMQLFTSDTTDALALGKVSTLSTIAHRPFKEFIDRFWEKAYQPYYQNYSVLGTYAPHAIRDVKIQKTRPGEGYHIWHAEQGNPSVSMRILTFILYLNDIEDGGETEFLYNPKRIKPKQGTLIIWPTGFTHAHRGNPPLKDTKYIMTGWVELVGN